MTDALRALVVDDNEVNRILACRLLAKRGWSVAEAEDGAQALTWMQANQADLVLLDISMPHVSGEEVCRRARAEGFSHDAKLVAYTAHAMPEERSKFLACGFDSVLVKPVSRATMIALLQDLGFPEPEGTSS